MKISYTHPIAIGSSTRFATMALTCMKKKIYIAGTGGMPGKILDDTSITNRTSVVNLMYNIDGLNTPGYTSALWGYLIINKAIDLKLA